VEENGQSSMFQAYPNPFGDRTTIQFNHTGGPIELVITDLQGRLLARLLKLDELAPGNYTIVWDGNNTEGSHVANGIYFCHFNNSEKTNSIKIIHFD
jgi:flagellar hook assembly protein FlgD